MIGAVAARISSRPCAHVPPGGTTTLAPSSCAARKAPTSPRLKASTMIACSASGVLAAERTGSSDIAAPLPSDRIITPPCGRAASSIHPRYLGDCEETCPLTFDPPPLLPTGEVTDNGLPAAVMPRMTEIELRERDVNKFTALARADRLVHYLPRFAPMSGQHRRTEPEAGDVACLDPRAATDDGEFVRVGGCRARRAPIARGEPCSPALPRGVCGHPGAFRGGIGRHLRQRRDGTCGRVRCRDNSRRHRPLPPCRFRSNSAWQFMFSTGGAGVEATNRAHTGHLAVPTAA